MRKVCTSLLLVLSILISLSVNSQIKLKLIKKNGIYTIPCKVNGKSLEFYFDTGASDVTLSIEEASDLYNEGLLLPSDIVGSNLYQVANGKIEEGIIVLLKIIEIGNIKIYNVTASVTMSSNAPLLLGQTALSKLGAFTFDYANNTLTINGPKTFDFLKSSSLNQNVKKNYYVYRNTTLFSGDVPLSERKLKWKASRLTPIVKSLYSDSIIYTLKPNEPFTAISNETHIFHMPVARISKIVPNDFADCDNENFAIGDLVYFLMPDWEGYWNVLHNSKETFINCTFDIENKQLGERAFEGCNNVEGKILSSKWEYIFWVKIKTKNGIEGWIRNPPISDFTGHTNSAFEIAN